MMDLVSGHPLLVEGGDARRAPVAISNDASQWGAGGGCYGNRCEFHAGAIAHYFQVVSKLADLPASD